LLIINNFQDMNQPFGLNQLFFLTFLTQDDCRWADQFAKIWREIPGDQALWHGWLRNSASRRPSEDQARVTANA
jgi:hypothetical protein